MADYAISNVPRRVVYAPSGVGPYAFTFEILAQTDIAVYKGSTLLTLTTDYTVTINANGTGSVTLVASAGTSNITIIGARAIQRSSDYTTGGDLFASTLNTDLDSQTIFSQQVAETAQRSLKAAITDSTALNMDLPAAQTRANKLLGFTAGGEPVASNTTVSQLDAAVQSFVSGTGNNAATVVYAPAGSGAVTTTVQAKLRQIVSVKDFGAVGDGVTNDSAAFQNAVNSVSATGGCISIPAGQYKLNSQIVYSGKSIQIIGEGVEVTKILVNNSNGAFDFTFTTTSVTFDFLTFSDMSIIATGALNNGTALKATWPNPSLLPASPATVIENVYIRSNVYTVNTASTPYFTNCIYLVNVANSRIVNNFTSQIGNQISKGIYIDNSAATSAFFLEISGNTLQGNEYGIYMDGWIEACHIEMCEIVAPQYAIYFDNTSATPKLPQISISRTHCNTVKKSIYLNSFQDILIDGCNILIANDSRNTTELTVNAIELVGCQYARITNSILIAATSPSAGIATATNAILLDDCNAVTVSANQFQVETGGSITSGNAKGVNVSTDTDVVQIFDNQFRAQSGTFAKYVYVEPQLLSNERISVYGNQFNDGLVGIEFVDVANGLSNNNRFDAITTPVLISGSTITKSASLINYDNLPRVNQTLTVNSATPSVGSALNTWFAATNTTATTITNFLNGYDGQVIEIYFSNGNTTIQHNANIFTKTGSNFTGTAGDLISLTFIYGAWRVTWTRP